jgi:hypothetical protein
MSAIKAKDEDAASSAKASVAKAKATADEKVLRRRSPQHAAQAVDHPYVTRSTSARRKTSLIDDLCVRRRLRRPRREIR